LGDWWQNQQWLWAYDQSIKPARLCHAGFRVNFN
jgi:hypothetical protein